MTFDRALEIIRIILELRSQIRSLVPMRILIMRIIAASKKCGLFWSRFNFTTIIRIIEFVNGVLDSHIPHSLFEYTCSGSFKHFVLNA